MGQSPNSQNYTSNSEDYILVQGNADISNGWVKPRVWTTQVTKMANKGAIILSVRAPVGEVGKTQYPIVLGRGVAGIEGDEFVFQLLIKMKNDFVWRRLSTGSTFDSINSKDLKSIRIFTPKEPEKVLIGQYLEKLDQIVNLHQRKINKMKEIKLLYLEKLFAIAEFLRPNIRFKSYTNEWISSHIKKYLIERNERSKIGDLVSVTIDSGVLKTESLNRKNNSSDDKSNYKVVKEGDIPYNSMRMWQGASGLSPFNGILSPAYTVLIPKETASGQFFSYQFKSRSMLYQFQKFSQGLTSDTWNLKYPLLKNIKISVPEFKEQKEIGDFLSKIDKNIELHQHRINQLKTLKKVYLDKIFI